jgi:hypothetical protein
VFSHAGQTCCMASIMMAKHAAWPAWLNMLGKLESGGLLNPVLMLLMLQAQLNRISGQKSE